MIFFVCERGHEFSSTQLNPECPQCGKKSEQLKKMLEKKIVQEAKKDHSEIIQKEIKKHARILTYEKILTLDNRIGIVQIEINYLKKRIISLEEKQRKLRVERRQLWGGKKRDYYFPSTSSTSSAPSEKE